MGQHEELRSVARRPRVPSPGGLDLVLAHPQPLRCPAQFVPAYVVLDLDVDQLRVQVARHGYFHLRLCWLRFTNCGGGPISPQPPGPELNGADRGRLKVLSPEYAKPDKSGTPGTVAHDRPTLDRSRKRAPFRPFPGLATGTRVVIPSSPGHRPRRRVNRRRFEAKVHPHGALDHVRWKAVTGIARRGHGHRYAAPALRKSANVTSPPCERSWMADPATSAGLHAVWPGQYWRKRT
jgi:hypothetical protein